MKRTVKCPKCGNKNLSANAHYQRAICFDIVNGKWTGGGGVPDDGGDYMYLTLTCIPCSHTWKPLEVRYIDELKDN